ncbi:oxidized low-density lipoprotein receptor 1 isoform X2 [Choloepus didactylus]|uniref:oxidized low-density lipoprotein receptor 1 isoform X2 n=1 Tax=Choloepus didactylus TaxID=27675 RepID=UPI00189FA567|nr:oxidized low-density lipoprotein receptor 1 isoform X2 [Choloepus didactylus]
MNLEMMCDDFKMKTMKDQPDQKLNGEKSKGCHLLSRFWRPAAVILGIICLALLTTTVLLGVQLSQVSALLKQQQGNLTRQEHVPEGQMSAQRQVEGASQESLKELNEMIEFLAQKLEESSRKQMELHHQNLNLQEALKKAANFSGPCPQDWIWHEENCYQFSSSPSSWEKSQESCRSLDAQLLKINSSADLEFIQQASAHSSFPFWMGLSLRKLSNSWLWEDGSPWMSSLFKLRGAVSQMYPSGTCAYIQRGVAYAESCNLSAFCICQKKANLLRA